MGLIEQLVEVFPTEMDFKYLISCEKNEEQTSLFDVLQMSQ